MALTPNQLTANKSPAAADTIASAIWDAANSMDVVSTRDASAQRMLKRHAEELIELHDSLDKAVILATPVRVEGNGQPRQLVDLGGNVREG